MQERISPQKIFGIGLNKTGTTTLSKCGEILGFRCTGCNRKLLEDVVLKNDFTRLKKIVSRYDLFEDWPWPLVYRQLDNLFPGSKFILTTRRNEERWLNSLKKHSLRTNPVKHCRKLAYGYNFPHKHEQAHLQFYKKHNDDVRGYFKDRKDAFLEVCWEHGDGWEKICAFLQKEVPDVPFPHANKGTDQKAAKVFWPLINRLLSRTGI